MFVGPALRHGPSPIAHIFGLQAITVVVVVVVAVSVVVVAVVFNAVVVLVVVIKWHTS
jgi:hypothetical protein